VNAAENHSHLVFGMEEQIGLNVKNPCNSCIVNSCCTQLCKDKENYREELNKILDGLHPHVLSINGHQRKKISNNIFIHWQKTINLQKINHQEINRILNRIYLNYAESVSYVYVNK